MEIEAKLLQPITGNAQDDLVAFRIQKWDQLTQAQFEEKKGRFKVTGPNGSQNGGESGVKEEA